MKQDALAHLFAKIGDAPECVARLRQVVVALAITGKLGLVDSTSNPSDILAKVEEVKTKLAALRAIPKPKKLAPVTEEDLPASFQDASCFASLGTVARIEKGLTGIKDAPSGPFPLVVTAAERGNCDHFDFDGAAAIIPLVSSTGHGHASINRLHYQDGKFALGSILAAVLPYDPAQVSARFLFEYLSAFKDELLVARMTGSANVTLSIGRIAEVPVPLVCPAVQRTVDELMALCDRLEEAREEREAARDRLTAASLARLNAPDPDPATFTTQARFALDNLPALTTRADQIKQLRHTILNLAVRGKLVKQYEADEPSSDLLRRISIENAKLMQEKSIKAQKPGIPTEEDLPHPILPSGWERVCLQDIAYQITDGTHLTPKYTETGKPFLSAQNVKPFRFMPDKHRFVSAADFEAYRANRRAERGDILMTRVGAGIGEATVLNSDLQFAFYVSLCLIKIPQNLVSTNYLVLWLNGPDGRQNSASRTYGKGASQGNLNLSQIRTFKIPLPPLPEQHRIVAKVDELMALCDQLETCLATGDETRQRLLEAVLHKALEPAEARELESV